MELFAVSEEEKKQILKIYETDKSKVERDVKILEEWLRKQPHLPQKFLYENFLEKTLLANKFRIERAKEKIDNYFSLRNVYRELYDVFKSEKCLSPLSIKMTVLPLPKLGPNKERIILLKHPLNPDFYNYDEFLQLFLMVVEMILHYDHCNGIRVFNDMSNFSMNHLKKMNFAKLAKLNNLNLEAYSFRVVGLDLLNMSPTVSVLMTFLKSVLRGKIFQRIKLHNSLESIYEVIPKSVLPKEYGGEQESVKELLGKLDNLFQKDRELFKKLPDIVSDESLRVGGRKDFSGMDGTFKQLVLD